MIATIKILPKKNDPTNIKNWMPISLLGMDNMIVSKIFWNRLTPIISELIDPHQTCGTTGRKIVHILNILYDTWDRTNNPNQPRGKLIYTSLVQKKALTKLNNTLYNV